MYSVLSVCVFAIYMVTNVIGFLLWGGGGGARVLCVDVSAWQHVACNTVNYQ